MQVLLFETKPKTRECGRVDLIAGEGHKEGARRWLRQHHGLALLDVETSHIVRREVSPSDSIITRTAIAVVVRKEKLKQAGGGGVFTDIERLTRRDSLRSVPRLSDNVHRDLTELSQFLVPWMKTAGKNGTAC